MGYMAATGGEARTSRLRRATFWVRRYGPAEAACLATMLAASLVATTLTTSPPALAASAIAGATVGFYGVLIVTVAREQRTALAVSVALAGGRERGYARRVVTRTLLLLVAEFGPAEVLDTFVWRPALMIAGVTLIGQPVLGLLVGKVVSDLLFYTMSALGFTATELTGARGVSS